jgi:hypothetical protein
VDDEWLANGRLENRAAFAAAGNFGEKSDILRYEVGASAPTWACLLVCPLGSSRRHIIQAALVWV